jgi:glycosyltransferase involved in cell wall biosynthesis
MRIAQVAPLYESVPPVNYGGTERVVSYLTEELVRAGHRVTLFASGDSMTAARLIPCSSESLRQDTRVLDPVAHHFTQMEKVCEMASEFDIIHFHNDYTHFSLSKRMGYAHISTLHGRLDLPDLQPLFQYFSEIPLVSISDSQRTPLPWLNWQGTVYHGMPEDLFTFVESPGTYLAFLGRLSLEKRVDRAIEIAKRSGLKLKIAAKIDKADKAYFESEIRHLFDDPLVEYVGEIGGRAKDAFLGNARALLFPIDWPEPFGLAMIEAMACGTPVIAYRNGSVPEVVREGVSGFIVDNIHSAVEAVRRADSIDRRSCRREFEERFTSRRMAREYVSIYESVLAGSLKPGFQAVQAADHASAHQ